MCVFTKCQNAFRTSRNPSSGQKSVETVTLDRRARTAGSGWFVSEREIRTHTHTEGEIERERERAVNCEANCWELTDGEVHVVGCTRLCSLTPHFMKKDSNFSRSTEVSVTV